MSDLGLVLPIGLISLVVFFFLRRIDDSPVTAHWAKAWIALYLAGLLAGADAYVRWAGDLAQIPLQLFAGYLLAGALAYTGRDVPRWVIPITLALGCLRTLQSATLGASSVHLSTLVTLPPFALSAAFVLWQAEGIGRWRTPEGWLAPLITAIAAMTLIDPLVHLFGAPTLPLSVGWISTALAVAFVQLMVMEDRVRSRHDDLLQTLEQQADLLGDERSRLRALIDASPAGILFVDRTGVIRAANPILLDHLGEDPSHDWIGSRSSELQAACENRVARESRLTLSEWLVKMQNDPSARIEDIDVHFLDPRQRVIRLDSAPVRSSSGQLQGRLWLSLDVTRERLLSRQLQESRRMETLGTLAGGVAHDFNNHLTPVLGNAWLLRQSIAEDDPLQAVARDIEDAAQHCAAMTRDLLTLARRAPARPQPVETKEALEKAVARLARRLTPDERVNLDMPNALPPLEADLEQLARVLDNVLGNARDAIEGRGEIRVRARAESDPDEAPTFVNIEIRDDGRGMDAETRGHIFEPFFTTKDVGEGNGLGLAIAYGIIEAHCAEIEVRSEPDAGTGVHIRWPVAKDPATRSPSSTRRSKVSGSAAHPAALLARSRHGGGLDL